jgi:hypothetical protein
MKHAMSRIEKWIARYLSRNPKAAHVTIVEQQHFLFFYDRPGYAKVPRDPNRPVSPALPFSDGDPLTGYVMRMRTAVMPTDWPDYVRGHQRGAGSK